MEPRPANHHRTLARSDGFDGGGDRDCAPSSTRTGTSTTSAETCCSVNGSRTLPYPFFDTPCPKQWQEGLARIFSSDFQRLVPGYGPVVMPADLERYRKAFDNLLACGTSERNNQACANGWIADAGSLVLENEHHVARRALNDYIDNFLRPTAKM